jgi:hypothetical protein
MCVFFCDRDCVKNFSTVGGDRSLIATGGKRDCLARSSFYRLIATQAPLHDLAGSG